MTEDEAKTKWCPFTRGETSALRLASSSSCVGSLCMAWRWTDVEESETGVHPHTWNDLKPFHEKDTTRRFIRHGRCGLTHA